jgi:hypothetical protein
MPAMAAAGMVWQASDWVNNDQTAVHSTLLEQPSIVNWADLPTLAQ